MKISSKTALHMLMPRSLASLGPRDKRRFQLTSSICTWREEVLGSVLPFKKLMKSLITGKYKLRDLLIHNFHRSID